MSLGRRIGSVYLRHRGERSVDARSRRNGSVHSHHGNYRRRILGWIGLAFVTRRKAGDRYFGAIG